MVVPIVAFVGLVIVGAMVLVARYQRRGGRISRWWGAGFLWLIASFFYLSVVLSPEADQAHDPYCPLPGMDAGGTVDDSFRLDSELGPSTWQTWPPGTVCYDLDGNVTSRPGVRHAVGVVVSGAGSAAFLVAGAAAIRGRLHRRWVAATDVSDASGRVD